MQKYKVAARTMPGCSMRAAALAHYRACSASWRDPREGAGVLQSAAEERAAWTHSSSEQRRFNNTWTMV